MLEYKWVLATDDPNAGTALEILNAMGIRPLTPQEAAVLPSSSFILGLGADGSWRRLDQDGEHILTALWRALGRFKLLGSWANTRVTLAQAGDERPGTIIRSTGSAWVVTSRGDIMVTAAQLPPEWVPPRTTPDPDRYPLREIVMTNGEVHTVWVCRVLTNPQVDSLQEYNRWQRGPDTGRPSGPPELRRLPDGGVLLSWDAAQLGVVAELPPAATRGKTLAQIEGVLVTLYDTYCS